MPMVITLIPGRRDTWQASKVLPEVGGRGIDLRFFMQMTVDKSGGAPGIRAGQAGRGRAQGLPRNFYLQGPAPKVQVQKEAAQKG